MLGVGLEPVWATVWLCMQAHPTCPHGPDTLPRRTEPRQAPHLGEAAVDPVGAAAVVLLGGHAVLEDVHGHAQRGRVRDRLVQARRVHRVCGPAPG